MHVEHRRDALLPKRPRQWKRVRVVAHHEVQSGFAAGAQGAWRNRRSPRRGETGAVGVVSEVVTNDGYAVHRFQRSMFLPAIKGVHRDFMAGLDQPACLAEYTGLGARW